MRSNVHKARRSSAPKRHQRLRSPHTVVNLRKVGGSVMLAIPPAMLESLDLEAGTAVEVKLSGQRLVIEVIDPEDDEEQPKPGYTLDELLAQCNARAKRSKEDEEWLNSPRIGRELL